MNNIFAGYVPPQKVESCAYRWQQQALDFCTELKVINKYKSQVMRYYKLNESKAEAVRRFMSERGITNIRYFLKSLRNEKEI